MSWILEYFFPSPPKPTPLPPPQVDADTLKLREIVIHTPTLFPTCQRDLEERRVDVQRRFLMGEGKVTNTLCNLCDNKLVSFKDGMVICVICGRFGVTETY